MKKVTNSLVVFAMIVCLAGCQNGADNGSKQEAAVSSEDGTASNDSADAAAVDGTAANDSADAAAEDGTAANDSADAAAEDGTAANDSADAAAEDGTAASDSADAAAEDGTAANDSPVVVAGDGTVSFNSLDTVDQTMLKNMSEIYSTCTKEADQLWPGYRFEDAPLLLVRADQNFGSEVTGAFSFQLDKFDDDMNAAEVTDIPDNFGLGKVMYLPYNESNEIEKDWTDTLNFHFAELQGVHIMYFKYYPEQDMHRQFVQFLTHEAFHEFLQVKLWKNVDNLTSLVNIEGDYQEEVIQSDILRGVMAQQMMRTLNLDDLKEIVMDSMILQKYLFDKYPEQAQQKQVETIEGSAQYVCVRIDNLMHGEFVDNISYPYFINYHSGFLKDWDEIKDAENWQSFFDKDIFYDTGTAYMTALDRFGVDYKNGINKDQKLLWYYLKKTFFPDGITYDDAQIKEIRDKYGYDTYKDISVKITEYMNSGEN